MGSIQAVQAMNLLLGRGQSLSGRLMVFNATDLSFTELRVRKDPKCPVCGANPTVTKLIDYDDFCGTRSVAKKVEEIAPKALKQRLDAGERIVLLDVREPYEHAFCNIVGSKLIPLSELEQRLDELNASDEIVVYCHTGVRSSRAVQLMTSKRFGRARNLTGGILAWAKDVDPAMPKY